MTSHDIIVTGAPSREGVVFWVREGRHRQQSTWRQRIFITRHVACLLIVRRHHRVIVCRDVIVASSECVHVDVITTQHVVGVCVVGVVVSSELCGCNFRPNTTHFRSAAHNRQVLQREAQVFDVDILSERRHSSVVRHVDVVPTHTTREAQLCGSFVRVCMHTTPHSQAVLAVLVRARQHHYVRK